MGCQTVILGFWKSSSLPWHMAMAVIAISHSNVFHGYVDHHPETERVTFKGLPLEVCVTCVAVGLLSGFEWGLESCAELSGTKSSFLGSQKNMIWST